MRYALYFIIDRTVTSVTMSSRPQLARRVHHDVPSPHRADLHPHVAQSNIHPGPNFPEQVRASGARFSRPLSR
jgi:hypothetical protein